MIMLSKNWLAQLISTHLRKEFLNTFRVVVSKVPKDENERRGSLTAFNR